MKMIMLILLLILVSCATPQQNYTTKSGSDPVKLCFIGDVGVNDSGQAKVAKALALENCDSIHFLGDIIYENGLENEHDKDFQKKFWNFYEPLTITGKKPVLYMVMGNHDHKGSIPAWIKLSEKHPKIFFPNPYYDVKMNDICLTHIDTDYFLLFSNYFQMYTQKKWLDSLDHKDCRIKIALGHHPYNSSGNDHGNSDWPLRSILEKHIIGKYDFYIAGHEHILADEGVQHGTHLLISGAGGKVDKGFVNGFLVLTVKEKETPLIEFRKVP